MKNKMHQLNIRLDEKNFEILNKISRESSQSPSTLGSYIVKQWIEFYYCKMRRGDVIFSQPILKKLLDALDKSHIDDVSEFMANYIIKEIKMQEGDVKYSVLVDHIIKWNRANHLPISVIEKTNHDANESDIFVSHHNLGRTWSEMECKTYMQAFEMIGKTIMSNEYDEDTFSFEVIKTRKFTN